MIQQALATTQADSQVFGFIAAIDETGSTPNYIVHHRIYVNGLTGLTPNTFVYLTDAGGISATPGTVNTPIGLAISTTEALLFATPLSTRAVNLANATGTLPPANGGTGSGTTLVGGKVMVSVGQTIVEQAAPVTVLQGGIGANNANGGLNNLLPDQSSANGKVLQSDGSNTSWQSGISLPSQVGENGKVLGTDGANASWVATTASLPSQGGHGGQFLSTDGSNLSWQSAGASTGYSPEFIANGGMDIFQCQGPSVLTNYADGAYGGPDRFFLLGNSGATDIAIQRAGGDTGATYASILQNNNGSTMFISLAQILENVDARKLRGQTVYLHARVKMSSAARTMKCAIVEWTGTADVPAFGGAVGRDPVLNWASTNYTAGNFFQNTSLTVTAVSSNTAVGTSYVDLYATGAVSTSCNNLVVMFWEVGGTAAGAYWTICEASLILGNAAQIWTGVDQALNLERCQRWYQKSYDPDTYPAYPAANTIGLYKLNFGLGTVAAIEGTIPFRTTMRAIPVMSYWDNAATPNASKITYIGNANNMTGTPEGVCTRGFSMLSDASSTKTGMSFHWVADARL